MKMTSYYQKNKAITKKTALTSTLIIALAALSACATPIPRVAPDQARFPIEVAESIERLELYTRPTGLELSARDTDAVALFLSGYQRHGSGQVLINMPSNSAYGLGAQQAEGLIRNMMRQGGMAPQAVRMAQYNVPPQASAPVVVSYKTLKTMPRDCRSMGSLLWTGTNQASDSYGCSHSANLAAMIQDPRQLIEPLPYGVSSAQRRMQVYDKYIEGEGTSSEFPGRQVVTVGGN